MGILIQDYEKCFGDSRVVYRQVSTTACYEKLAGEFILPVCLVSPPCIVVSIKLYFHLAGVSFQVLVMHSLCVLPKEVDCIFELGLLC